MRYWWVNHGDMHRTEIAGGFMWSPVLNKNGHRLNAYDNMTKVSAGDLVFAYADTRIRAVGVIAGACRSTARPASYKDGWSNDGWLVPVDWQMLATPLRPKDHIELIRDLLPLSHSPLIRASGLGSESYLSEIDSALYGAVLDLIQDGNESALEAAAGKAAEIRADVAESSIADSAGPRTTETKQLVLARRGQGVFRSNVSKLEKSCRLTGVMDEAFLVASHIKPWAVSSDSERLDGSNGLLLAPHVDRLFDRGWISFEDSGAVKVWNARAQSVLVTWGLASVPRSPSAFSKSQAVFLAYHRAEIFGKPLREIAS